MNSSKFKFLSSILPRFLYLILKKQYFYILYLKDYFQFNKHAQRKLGSKAKWRDRYPQLLDKTENTNFDQHYIYHPAWAARIIKKINPEYHIDISSTLSFSSILSAFIPVRFYDFRPAKIFLTNLSTDKADLSNLHFLDNTISSLSCMHVIEHIGLGRYGDPIDSDGDIKAITELKRVVAPNGHLIVVVPIGKPKIAFNAHRIYSYEQFINYFDGFRLNEFSLIPDNSVEIGMILNANQVTADNQSYGCGCFWFSKLDSK